MRCIVCDHSEWENVDNLREKPEGMAMCKHCGFVSYPKKYATEDQIKEHYRKNYRPAPTAHNLFSGERKLYYHEKFLRPLIEGWKENGVTKPVIGEIGAAMGMFLHWMKFQMPGAEIHGTELTTSFRRVAKQEFGIELVEDFDFSRRYDLIVSYHVLEHQSDADTYLKRYAEALSDSGVIYLSTPVWFRDATNFGAAGFDLGYYWHPDHINAWSEEHLECVIAKAGLEIVYKNDDIYGNTYILKRGAVKANFDWTDAFKKHYDMAERIQKCWRSIETNQTAIAIEAWPNCPAAWVNHYELNRKDFNANSDGMKAFLDNAVKACPNTSDTLTLAGDVMHRYEKYDAAFGLFQLAEKKKPNNPTILLAMANCKRQKALRIKDNPEEREKLLNEAIRICRRVRDTSIEMHSTGVTWAFHDMALIESEAEHVGQKD